MGQIFKKKLQNITLAIIVYVSLFSCSSTKNVNPLLGKWGMIRIITNDTIMQIKKTTPTFLVREFSDSILISSFPNISLPSSIDNYTIEGNTFTLSKNKLNPIIFKINKDTLKLYHMGISEAEYIKTRQ